MRDGRPVLVDRLGADAENIGYLAAGVAFNQQAEHLLLPVGQPVEFRGLGFVSYNFV